MKELKISQLKNLELNEVEKYFLQQKVKSMEDMVLIKQDYDQFQNTKSIKENKTKEQRLIVKIKYHIILKKLNCIISGFINKINSKK